MSDETEGAAISDDALVAALAGELAPFPALSAVLPTGYPKGLVTRERMAEFDAHRKKAGAHWHLLNLPFALYMANQETWLDGADVAKSVLATLERFCSEFSGTPGFASVVKPLSSGVWKHDDPEFWSILAHSHISLMLRDQGFSVKAFSARMLDGPKDADILVGLSSGDAYVDIVMKHRPTFSTVEEARGELHRHEDSKVGTKFAEAIKAGLQAFVIVVCVVRGSQLQVLDQDPSILSAIDGSTLGRPPEVKIAFFALTGGRQEGRLSWRLYSRDEWTAATPAGQSGDAQNSPPS